ncbi:MAG: hypothetical protein ACSLFP_05395 [Acidimicrobiales bacterium]
MHGSSRTPVLLIAVLSVVLVGCGDDDSTGSDGAGEAESSIGDDGSLDESGDDEATAGDDTATVVVGDTTYEFTMTYCASFMDGLAGSGDALDGSGTTLTISLPPEGLGDIPSITVDSDDRRWEADETLADMLGNLEAGLSEVTSFTVDGLRASGSASFVDTFSAATGGAEAIEGSFEMSCSS